MTLTHNTTPVRLDDDVVRSLKPENLQRVADAAHVLRVEPEILGRRLPVEGDVAGAYGRANVGEEWAEKSACGTPENAREHRRCVRIGRSSRHVGRRRLALPCPGGWALTCAVGCAPGTRYTFAVAFLRRPTAEYFTSPAFERAKHESLVRAHCFLCGRLFARAGQFDAALRLH